MADEPASSSPREARYTEGAVGAGLVLVVLPCVALYFGIDKMAAKPAIGLPILAIFGIMILFGALALISTLFARLRLSDGNQALALPEGSIRAADDLPWPGVQMDAYRRGVAAILRHVGQGVEFCAGHKEYALPAGRKSDPNFDMDAFRPSVAAIMDGTTPAPILIPAAEPAAHPGATPARATLRRGATGELVRQLQQKAGLAPVDGIFDARTEAAIRAYQREHGLVPDGIVGPKTWVALDARQRRRHESRGGVPRGGRAR